MRRTLAVILAGHGDTALLIALARHDPELVVRETAMHLATRLAAGGKLELGVVLEASEREPAIRIAVLGAIDAGAPVLLVAFAHAQLACGVAAVELEAFEALVRIGTPVERTAARTWMMRQPDPTAIGLACERWLRVSTLESLAETFAAAPATIRALVLAQLRKPPWSAVERLVGDSLDLLRAALARPDIAIPARVLARAITSGAHQGFVERLTAQLAAAARGRTLIAEVRAAIEGDADAALVGRLAAQTRVFAQALEAPDAGAVLDELAVVHPVEHLIALENAIARWLGAIASGEARDHDAPESLVPILPALEQYCRDHIATLDPRRRAARPQLALRAGGVAGPGLQPWDEYRRFCDLIAALERFTRRD